MKSVFLCARVSGLHLILTVDLVRRYVYGCVYHYMEVDILIKETTDIETCETHSDLSGSGHQINCPNCGQRVMFADGQWWDSDCGCGEWELIQKAVLEVSE